MTNDIEGKVIIEGKILYKYGKGHATGATEEWASIEVEKKALSSILSLTTNPLDEKEVEIAKEFIMKAGNLTDLFSSDELNLMNKIVGNYQKKEHWTTAIKYMNSHFSKPVITKEQFILICSENHIGEGIASDIYNDMRKLNGEGV